MPRPCERCGQLLARKPGENTRDWKKRRFCSRACLLSVAPERRCLGCGEVLVRKRWSRLETSKNFRNRKYCEPACRVARAMAG